ncbi:hypothetical protein GGI43DRAFT_431750 [Trichoderma evansii]
MGDNDNTAVPPLGNLWRVTITGKRKGGWTREEFSRRYSLHGKLAGPFVEKYNGISYRLHHILDSHAEKLKEELSPQLSSQFSIADIDGFSTIVFPTAKDLAGFFSDPAYAKLAADASEFGDVTSIQFSVGDEQVVVQDGKCIV